MAARHAVFQIDFEAKTITMVIKNSDTGHDVDAYKMPFADAEVLSKQLTGCVKALREYTMHGVPVRKVDAIWEEK